MYICIIFYIMYITLLSFLQEYYIITNMLYVSQHNCYKTILSKKYIKCFFNT